VQGKRLPVVSVPGTTEQLESDMVSAGSLSGRYQGREEMVECELLLTPGIFLVILMSFSS